MIRDSSVLLYVTLKEITDLFLIKFSVNLNSQSIYFA